MEQYDSVSTKKHYEESWKMQILELLVPFLTWN